MIVMRSNRCLGTMHSTGKSDILNRKRRLDITERMYRTTGQTIVPFFCSTKIMQPIRFYCHCGIPFVGLKDKRLLAIKSLFINLI